MSMFYYLNVNDKPIDIRRDLVIVLKGFMGQSFEDMGGLLLKYANGGHVHVLHCVNIFGKYLLQGVTWCISFSLIFSFILLLNSG